MTAGINKFILKALVVFSLLPLVPLFLSGLTPAGLIVVLLGIYVIFAPVRRGVNAVLGGIAAGIEGVIKGIVALLKFLFRLLFWIGIAVAKIIQIVVTQVAGFGPSKNRFMGWWERTRLLWPHHQGPLVDGRKARLSEKAGYESLLVQGGMGRGKSSTFVLPNLLQPPQTRPSFVVSDTSGELFKASSGYLRRLGYQIRVLNLMNPLASETYNPLANIRHPREIAELAKTLIRTSGGRTNGQLPNDPFWEQAAEKLIRIMSQCLLNQPDPDLRNLANLRYLVASFDAHVAPQGQLGKIDQFVLDNTRTDPTTFSAYQAFVNGNLKTIQSVLMSADVALDPIATPELATLTATNTLDFRELRQRPTALFIIVNQTQMEHYAFLLNLFYAELFRALLQNEQNPGNPVWLFLDEFGHLQISGFEVFATTARKYKISYALFLQSLAQLDARYGATNARTIVEGLGTEIYLPGTSLKTARELEARLGREGKEPLMAANDIIRMKDNEALMLHSNKLPILLKTKRYYQRRSLAQRAKVQPAPLPQHGLGQPRLIQL